MVSKDRDVFRVSKETRKEIEKWREKISNALGVDIETVRLKHGEIAMRESAKNGSVAIKELQNILLGKIK